MSQAEVYRALEQRAKSGDVACLITLLVHHHLSDISGKLFLIAEAIGSGHTGEDVHY